MNTRKFSKKQEKRVAKNLGGKTVSNSGATPFDKGDVLTKRYLVECKTSIKDKNSVSIKRDWLEKAKEEAFAMGKSAPILVFDFGDGKDYAILSLSVLKGILGELEAR